MTRRGRHRLVHGLRQALAFRGATAVRVMLAAVLALSSWAGSLSGQAIIPNEPAFTSRGIEDGLSDGQVHALLQDRAGFLWVGTAGGLNRFDGVEFRIFRHDRDDARSLSDHFVRSLAQDGDGQLWVGTDRGGLNRFDPVTGEAARFELYELGPWTMDTLTAAGVRRQGRTVHAIVPMPDSSLLLATDIGLLHFDVRTAAATRIASPSLPEAGVGALCGLPNARAVAGFSDGTIALTDSTRKHVRVIAQLETRVTALRCHSATAVFAGLFSGAVFAVDLRTGETSHVASIDPDAGQPVAVHDILIGPDGNLWIATSLGLYVQEQGRGKLRRVGLAAQRGLPDQQISRFLVDASGMLWIGTWNGLASLHPLSLSMVRIPNETGAGPGNLAGGVIAIQSANAGEYWLGTYGGGVRLLRRTASGEWSLSQLPALDTLRDAIVFGFSRAANGELWIAALRGGVYRLDAARSMLTPVPIMAPDGNLVTSRLHSVFVDRNGDVWAGSETLGLLKYDARARRLRTFRGPDGNWDFGSSYVWPIAEDAHGNLWIGAYNGGVSMIDADRRTHRLHAAGGSGLNDARILTVFPDSRGYIWIGTQGSGLNRLEPATGSVKIYTTRDGLPHDNVEAVREDASGDLWISTNDGLARFDPETEEFFVIREAAGLTGNRFFANSVHAGPRGELLFGGPTGVTIIEPERIDRRPFRPAVALTRFRIRSEEVSLIRARPQRGLDLEPNENFFTFEFSAMDFRDSSLNRYRYQLVGLDEAWIDNGSRRIANYTSVPPRRYTFRVQAAHGQGAWSGPIFSIPIRVQAPYYQTWWFRASVAAGVLALISAFYTYRLHELKRRQELRLGIAGRLHDDIGADLSAIALKADLFAATAELDEKRRSQLSDVGRLARQTALKVRETVWVVNTQYDTVAGLLVKMRDTADTMLQGHVEFRFTEPASLPDQPLDMQRRQDFYLMFKEALHNIVKHAAATFVEIQLRCDSTNLTCTIRDDGKGFDPSAASHGSGLGLMRTRAQRHRGQLSIDATPGKGTTITFRIRIR
jgi:signal transduction histidine kinase/ligand-binding sensor domain-containing protein